MYYVKTGFAQWTVYNIRNQEVAVFNTNWETRKFIAERTEIALKAV